MMTTEQDLLAKEIIQRTRAETLARAVLEREPHSPWMTLFALLTVAVAAYLMSRVVPAHEYLDTLLAVMGVWLTWNTVDSWQDRRRLEAAITLLKLREKTA